MPWACRHIQVAHHMLAEGKTQVFGPQRASTTTIGDRHTRYDQVIMTTFITTGNMRDDDIYLQLRSMPRTAC